MESSVPGSRYTWSRVPEAFGWPQTGPFPVQLLPGVPIHLPRETPVPVGPCESTNAQYQADVPRQHVHLSYPRDPASANNVGYHGPTTTTSLERSEYSPTFASGPGNVHQIVGGEPMIRTAALDVVQPCAFDRDNPSPQLEGLRAGEPPVDYGTEFSVPYTRRTKTGRRAPVGGPPQTFEGNLEVLATRLIGEGADPIAVDLVRHVIFVAEVTEGALNAPIKSRQLSLKHGGVRKKWQLLLQVTEVVPGVKSHCCRLCPQERRPEYKNAVDGLRHLKRDHFGISVACWYWYVTASPLVNSGGR
jgi:hypothetical protein